jgi:excisionase family DNA binding protein
MFLLYRLSPYHQTTFFDRGLASKGALGRTIAWLTRCLLCWADKGVHLPIGFQVIWGDAIVTKKGLFTTGQVAKICKVAPRTVNKWVDSGLLRGYRIPGSQDRRVTEAGLDEFLAENGLPPRPPEPCPRIGLAFSNYRIRDATISYLPSDCQHSTCEVDLFDLGLMLATNPHFLLIEISLDQPVLPPAVKRLCERSRQGIVSLGLYLWADTPREGDLFESARECFSHPMDPQLLAFRSVTLAKENFAKWPALVK